MHNYSPIISLRPGCSTRGARKFGPRTCLNIDAWLIQPRIDFAYFYLSARAGMYELHDERAWIIQTDPTFGLPALAPCVPEALGRIDTGDAITFDQYTSSATRRAFLLDTHWRVIAPLAWQPLTAGFKRRSMSFHYVDLGDQREPTDGLSNLYEGSWREERDKNVQRARQAKITNLNPTLDILR